MAMHNNLPAADRRVRVTIYAAAIALASAAVAAQQPDYGGYARVEMSSAEIFNGNLFSTPFPRSIPANLPGPAIDGSDSLVPLVSAAARSPEADLFSRFGTAIETGYVAVPVRLIGRYELDAERYMDHPELNKNVARQDGSLTLDYAPIPRLVISAGGTYLQTYNPAEFNVESELAVGRIRGERTTITSGLAYAVSQVGKLSGTYEFARDVLESGYQATVQTWHGTYEGRTGMRNGFRFDGEMREIDFIDGGPPERSYVGMAGWVYGLTQRTNVEISGGPRFTADGTIRPEISAMIRRRLRLAELSAGYWRTDLVSIGERGTIDMQRYGGGVTVRPLRHLTLTLLPSYTRSEQNDHVVPVYAAEGELVIEMTRKLSFVTSGRLARQEGILGGPPLGPGPLEIPVLPPAAIIPDRMLSLRLVVTLPHSGPSRPPVDVVTGRRTPPKK